MSMPHIQEQLRRILYTMCTYCVRTASISSIFVARILLVPPPLGLHLNLLLDGYSLGSAVVTAVVTGFIPAPSLSFAISILAIVRVPIVFLAVVAGRILAIIAHEYIIVPLGGVLGLLVIVFV